MGCGFTLYHAIMKLETLNLLVHFEQHIHQRIFVFFFFFFKMCDFLYYYHFPFTPPTAFCCFLRMKDFFNDLRKHPDVQDRQDG